MVLRKTLILRRPETGRLEGRTTLIQLETGTPSLGGSGATPLGAWCEAGLALCALALPPFLALVPHGAAPLAGFAGLCAAGLIAAQPPYDLRALRRPAALLGALVLWGAVSAAWSIEPGHSLVIAARLAGLFAAALALAGAASRVAQPRRLTLFLFAGTAIGIAI